MLTLLEKFDMELVHMRASFSPSAQRKLQELREKSLRRLTLTSQVQQNGGSSGDRDDPSLLVVGGAMGAAEYNYPFEEISASREVILKLTDRVEVLLKRCRETVSNAEEVMEILMRFEGGAESTQDVLSGLGRRLEGIRPEAKRGYSVESWKQLREVRTYIYCICVCVRKHMWLWFG